MKLIKLILFSILLTSCTSTKKLTKNNDVGTPNGKIKYYQTTTNFGLHLMGIYPFWGNADLGETINQFTLSAKKDNATSVRIIQKDTTRLYVIFPPLSFIVMPVATEVIGEVYGE